jgi:hypothetical protein
MTDKQKNLGNELADVVRVAWRYLVQACRWLATQLGAIRLQQVRQVIGVLIIIATSLALVFDTIAAILLIGDPYQVSKIMYASTGVDLFAHISLAEYVGLIAGGVIMDIAILTLILWLGIYLFCEKNYFIKPRKAWLYTAGIAVLGAAICATSVFYMLPDIMKFEQEVHARYHENKVYAPIQQMHRGYPAQQEMNAYYQLEQEAEHMEQMMEELMYEYNINQVYYR